MRQLKPSALNSTQARFLTCRILPTCHNVPPSQICHRHIYAFAEAEAYQEALAQVPHLLSSLSDRDAPDVAPWSEGWDRISEGWAHLQEGTASVSTQCDGALLLVCEPSAPSSEAPEVSSEVSSQVPSEASSEVSPEVPRDSSQVSSSSRLAPAAVHRALCELRTPTPCTRWLRVQRRLKSPTSKSDGEREYEYMYEYELPGHGWVKKLVTRRPVPPPPDKGRLACALMHALGGVWSAGGGGAVVDPFC